MNVELWKVRPVDVLGVEARSVSSGPWKYTSSKSRFDPPSDVDTAGDRQFENTTLSMSYWSPKFSDHMGVQNRFLTVTVRRDVQRVQWILARAPSRS